MSRFKHYLMTSNSVVIVTDSGLIPVDRANPLFGKITKALTDRAFDALESLLDASKRITKYSGGQFWVKDGVVMIGESTLPEALSKRLLSLVDSGLDATPLVAFWNNLALNPSEDSKKDLYAFLEHNGIPITEDGCFIAYKRVREDFKDHHTGTLDYSVEKVVRMRREDCDGDRRNTCSRGLHVAAFKYAHDMYYNGHLLECKVNPKDVVAVPVDYDNEKMRVCELQVVKVSAGPRKELVYPRFKVDDQVVATNDDGSEVGGRIEEVIPAAENEIEASYNVLLDEDENSVPGLLYTYKESSLKFKDDGDDPDNGEDYDEDEDDFEEEDDEALAYGEEQDRLDAELDAVEAEADRLAEAEDKRFAALFDESQIDALDSLDSRISALEENSATKKDVADSTNEIIGRLDIIRQRMDNAADSDSHG